MLRNYLFAAYILAISSISLSYEAPLQEAESFIRGMIPTLGGMCLGHIVGNQLNHEKVGEIIGAMGGAAIDHYYLGGKEDPHQIARKLGNAAPIVVRSGIVIIRTKRNDNQVYIDTTLDTFTSQERHPRVQQFMHDNNKNG